jgi:hypothetical protein
MSCLVALHSDCIIGPRWTENQTRVLMLNYFSCHTKKVNTFVKSLLLPLQGSTCSSLHIIQLQSHYKNFHLDHTDSSINSWLISSRLLNLVLRLWTLLFSYHDLMAFHYMFSDMWQSNFRRYIEPPRLCLNIESIYSFEKFVRNYQIIHEETSVLHSFHNINSQYKLIHESKTLLKTDLLYGI